MRMLLFAGLLVVSPALVVILWFLDRPMWVLPALASLTINSLPFIAAVLILRAQKRRGQQIEHH